MSFAFPPHVNGILPVFKRAGTRSRQVVDDVLRILLMMAHGTHIRVGHGGTLDQFAEGVLVVGVGRGCRRLRELLDGPKSYRAVGKLGVLTDTLDPLGKVEKRSPFDHVRREHIENRLSAFSGEFEQIPPASVVVVVVVSLSFVRFAS
jgi:tRNA pseudouridine55 synthase